MSDLADLIAAEGHRAMTDLAETVKWIREHLPPEAMQEEWKYVEGSQCYPFVVTEGDIVCVPDPNHGVPDVMDQRNFKYIVAVQPKFIRAILAELERVTGERDAWQSTAASQAADAANAEAQVASLEAQLAAITTERTTPDDAAVSIGREIIEIMETYDEQEARGTYGGTPGGLEHMGDVWRLLSGWRDELKRAQHPTPSQETAP